MFIKWIVLNNSLMYFLFSLQTHKSYFWQRIKEVLLKITEVFFSTMSMSENILIVF